MNQEQQAIEKHDFSALSVAERILLAEALFDSVQQSVQDAGFTQAQEQELGKRAALEEAGLLPGEEWHVVKKRLDEI